MLQKVSGGKKVYGKERGRGAYQNVPSKIFCLKVPTKIAGESFILSIFPCIEKIYASEGFVTIIRRIFCLTVPKFFVEEPFCAVLQKFSGGEKVHEKEGRGASIVVYRRKIFVSKRRQNSQGNLLFCQYFRVSKKFMLQRVLSRLSVEFFVSQYRNFS